MVSIATKRDILCESYVDKYHLDIGKKIPLCFFSTSKRSRYDVCPGHNLSSPIYVVHNGVHSQDFESHRKLTCGGPIAKVGMSPNSQDTRLDDLMSCLVMIACLYGLAVYWSLLVDALLDIKRSKQK